MFVKLLTYTSCLVKCNILVTYSDAIVWFMWRYYILKHKLHPFHWKLSNDFSYKLWIITDDSFKHEK